jgi:tRNA (pseudouridine54-N1)-methyltransferase
MTLIFVIHSETVNLDHYTIKDLPGSSGRIDVLCRCILAALYLNSKFEKNVQIWVFIDNYGTFIFNSEKLNVNFPKNELLLAKYFIDYILHKGSNVAQDHPLNSIETTEISIFKAIEDFMNDGCDVFILNEDGEDLANYITKNHLKKDQVFVLGDQTGNSMKKQELIGLNLINLSLGKQSYLASSVIRLVKIRLLTSQ